MRAGGGTRRHVAAAIVGVGLCMFAAGAPASAADRAFELVTPPGSDGESRAGGGAAAPDGNIVCYNAEKAMAESQVNGQDIADDGFCSRRTAAGWQTDWVTGPAVKDLRGYAGSQIYFVSSDGSRVAFASDMGIFADYPGDPPGTSVYGTLSAYMWEGGKTRWLAPAPEPLREARVFGQAVGTSREPLAASDDLKYGMFVSSLALVPQDTNGTLDVYEWTPDGTRLVSRDDSGSAVGGWPGIGTDPNQLMAVAGSVSNEGSRVFFQHLGELEGSPPGVASVFMREGDELTLVSPRRGPGPAADVSFVGATADGAVAYLTSEEQLTNDPKRLGAALYSYDVADDQLSLVATAADDSGIVFLGSSADGSTVVYRTGSSELFVRRDGVDSSLGTMAFQDTSAFFDAGGNDRSDKRAMRISANGDTIVFASFASFDGSPGGVRQIYRWTPADGVRWISHDAARSAPVGNAGIGNFTSNLPFPGEPRYNGLNTLRGRPNLGRVMSDDGTRVFFETANQLVDADINAFVDVYEWRDGSVRLVSPGTQQADALYHDSSADGSTVFFTTRARLIPELDRNAGSDLYAAREGGGFALPIPPARCEQDACQGAVQPVPTQADPGSTKFEGPGDAQEPAPLVPRHTVVRLTAAQRRAFARSGRTTLRVKANEKGVVTATVRASIAGRNVVVARALKVAQSAKTTTLPLALSKTARTVLSTKGRLRLVISVSYSESQTTVRQVVVLRG